MIERKEAPSYLLVKPVTPVSNANIIVVLNNLDRSLGQEEREIFHQLVLDLLSKIKALASVDLDKPVFTVQIFDKLIECETSKSYEALRC